MLVLATTGTVDISPRARLFIKEADIIQAPGRYPLQLTNLIALQAPPDLQVVSCKCSSYCARAQTQALYNGLSKLLAAEAAS